VGELDVRPATADDRSAVLALLRASLGWGDADRFGEFFRWKHEQNPFGASYALVATDGDRIVGFRTFLRWEFVDRDGVIRRAVRAVDTATDPAYQGRGIFRTLTLHAVDELAADGVAFVFNTPNDKSRPGYLKMGWTEVGRLPTSIRFRSPAGALRMLRSRVPAERWSADVPAGRPAAEVLADPALEGLAGVASPGAALRTRRTAGYLRWRYDFEPLGYRAITRSSDLADGVAVFRLRRRGSSLEGAVCEVLVPGADVAARRALLRGVARAVPADYLLRLGGPVLGTTGFVRAPGQGPMLTWRPLTGRVAGGEVGDWDLGLGDIELF
jgi:GNAT superfamily N-acetyltransferase